MLGQVVEKLHNKTEQSTVRLKVDASKGAYLMCVENENGVTTKKVFIQ